MKRQNTVRNGGSPKAAKPQPAVPVKPAPVPPLFRRIDWLALLVAFGTIWTVYFLTLAPEETLEDSGELCTGAYYAGIPHAPGYPFWSIYAWAWTKLLPMGNVAWRVEVGEATAAALACGLVAFMVSRGSAMLMEGIEDLKSLTGKWESAICFVSGAVAGMLLGFGGVMWSESVAINRISLFGAPWVMLVMLCLMRWIYAPHQRRYLFWAMFFFGICATIHQTLLVAAMGIEAAIAYVQPKLGRSVFLGNSVLYLMGMIAQSTGLITMLNTAPMVLIIYHTVGIASIVAYFWFAILTKETSHELARDAALTISLCLLTAVPRLGRSSLLFSLVGLGAFLWLAWKTRAQGLEWLAVAGLGLAWAAGASFYFYEAIAGMTNPPMEWAYPRTVGGWFHALSRGQYEKASPSNPFLDPGHFLLQVGMLLSDIVHEYNWICLLIALVPLLFYFRMQKRERAWVLALTAVYLCIGGLLLILMNPQPDKQSADLNRVFFASSHAVIAILIGYGFALTASYIATHYQRIRSAGLMLGVLALVPALTGLYEGVSNTFYGGIGFVPYDDILLLFILLVAALVLTMLAAQRYLRLSYLFDGSERELKSAATSLGGPGREPDPAGAGKLLRTEVRAPLNRDRRATQADPLMEASGARLDLEPGSEQPAQQQKKDRSLFFVFGLGAIVLLGVAAATVFLRSDSLALAQLKAGLGRLFAPHQYKLPAIAGLMQLGIVLAFITALLAYRRRAPLAITLGLFTLMPLISGLSHWAGSEQRNHWFGYWFGHDMFTPPVVGPDGKMTYDAKVRQQMMNGPNGKLVYPEMDRDTILYGGTDPGRFNPTYMIFCDSFLPAKCLPAADPAFDRRDVYLITQNALADPPYLDYLRAQYFKSQQHDPPFFSELARYVLKDADYETNLLARIVSPLDWYFEARGARIEKNWRVSTSWFSPNDFLGLSDFAAKLKPSPDQDPVSKWLFQNLSSETQAMLAGPRDDRRLRAALCKDLNVLLERELKQKQLLAEKQNEKVAVDEEILGGGTSERLRHKQEELASQMAALKIEPLYDTNRFAEVKLSDDLRKFLAQNPQGDTRIRLNRRLLEAAYPIEIARSLGGVYPDREIYIPTLEDNQRCFSEYMADAERRLAHDRQLPNEPRLMKPGENVTIVPDANGQQRIQVSGQTAVFAINALLTKVIFDHCPDHEFYVEESAPLDWMFPHLTPYGIIMKINRQPVAEITEEMCQRDHAFWSSYSERLIGNWITYDTPVRDVAEFAERLYLHHDFTGFKGDPAFVRDETAQKSFSKLRGSIGGLYEWRLGIPPGGGVTPPQYLPKSEGERQRMLREADFALKQSFAFCPYNLEMVYRYINLLGTTGRLTDAWWVVSTCLKLDPYNGQVKDMLNRLRPYAPPGLAAR